MSSASVINERPQYIRDIDEALLARIFGSPAVKGEEFISGYDEQGNPIYSTATEADVGILSGGLIDRPDLFQIPAYTQADSPLQEAVTASFDTPEGRQEFFDRYQPYFTDDQGVARYLPDAASAMQTGQTTISDALTDFFPDAKTYLEGGRGSVDAKGIFDTELTDAKSKVDESTDAFQAKQRGEASFSDARDTVKGGLGRFSPAQIDSGGQFSPTGISSGGQFDARESFDRGTGRAFELAEQGLGSFDPNKVQEFMDPYKEQVIDAAMKKIAREGAKARQGEAARAIGAGAFGGSRAGVQIAETQRAQEEARAGTIANLMSQGYDKALASAIATDEAERKRALQASGLTGELGARGSATEQRAFEDAARRGLAAATTEGQMEQKAFEDAARRGLAAATTEGQMEQKAFEDAARRSVGVGSALGDIGKTQLGTEASAFESAEQRMAKAADMYRSMGLSSADAQIKAQQDEKKRSLEAGRLMGGLGQTKGALGGAQADIGKAYGQLAGTSADIGRVYAGMPPADLGFMYELGGKDRAYDQQYEDFLRQNELMKTQQALAPYSYGQTFLTGSPSASMYGQFTTTPSAAPNPFVSGVGTYTAIQGLNQAR